MHYTPINLSRDSSNLKFYDDSYTWGRETFSSSVIAFTNQHFSSYFFFPIKLKWLYVQAKWESCWLTMLQLVTRSRIFDLKIFDRTMFSLDAKLKEYVSMHGLLNSFFKFKHKSVLRTCNIVVCKMSNFVYLLSKLYKLMSGNILSLVSLKWKWFCWKPQLCEKNNNCYL